MLRVDLHVKFVPTLPSPSLLPSCIPSIRLGSSSFPCLLLRARPDGHTTTLSQRTKQTRP